MANINRFVWLLPFIGSILTAISLFTPTVVFKSLDGRILYYMDGFYLGIGGGSGPSPGFIGIPSLVIIGIICFILIITSTIIMFISSLTHRTTEKPGSWIALGIILIVGTIIYIAGAAYGYLIYSIIRTGEPANFWANGTPSFAVIAPFIAGGLSIVGFIAGKFTGKEEVEIKPISKQVPPVSEPISQPIPIEESQTVMFCPACGQKIPHSRAQFCPSCGYDLKKE